MHGSGDPLMGGSRNGGWSLTRQQAAKLQAILHCAVHPVKPPVGEAAAVHTCVCVFTRVCAHAYVCACVNLCANARAVVRCLTGRQMVVGHSRGG